MNLHWHTMNPIMVHGVHITSCCRASDVIASNQQLHLAFPSLAVTDADNTGTATMHVLYGLSKDGTYPPLNGQSPQAFPGMNERPLHPASA
jgi:hypothetical protein